ncbi:MAG TPA: D-aminoacyl-tRNA deacylase [Bacillota bacterium]|nr:D-aminoacyl-tRNA deacylase [Bacillota bacterium]
MRAVVQRVSRGKVTVADEVVGAIGPGLLVLVGVGTEDTEADVRYMGDKLIGLRIFEDNEGKMNLSVSETGGEILLISQFTLYGDCRKGRRPGFSDAAPPDAANRLYLGLVEYLRTKGLVVATGRFQADMAVELVNDGPVTLLLDSRKSF